MKVNELWVLCRNLGLDSRITILNEKGETVASFIRDTIGDETPYESRAYQLYREGVVLWFEIVNSDLFVMIEGEGEDNA